MSFKTVAQALRAVIAKHNDFSTSGSSRNTTIGDYSVIDQGVTRAAVITIPESNDVGRGATPLSRHGGYWSIAHTFTVEVLHRYTSDEETVENLLDDAWNVMTTINGYNTLDSTSGVVDCEASLAGPIVWGVSMGGANFAQVNLIVEVTEEFTQTFS